MGRKSILLIVYVIAAGIIYWLGPGILDWLRSTDQIVLVVVVATLLALFPVIPFPLAGAALGASYGPAAGGFLAWVASTLASLIMFAAVRYGDQGWGARVLSKYKGVDKLQQQFERNAFMAIALARSIPFIPSIIVNVYSALSRVRWTVYAAASALGKVPAMLLFAAAGYSIGTGSVTVLIWAALYGAFIALAAGIQWLWNKKLRGRRGEEGADRGGEAAAAVYGQRHPGDSGNS